MQTTKQWERINASGGIDTLEQAANGQFFLTKRYPSGLIFIVLAPDKARPFNEREREKLYKQHGYNTLILTGEHAKREIDSFHSKREH